MSGPYTHRRLRVAATAACLVACGLVVALWGRSYYWMDSGVASLSTAGSVRGNSYCGSLLVLVSASAWRNHWGLDHSSLYAPGVAPPPLRLGGEFMLLNNGIVFPHWFLVLVAGIAAAAPWVKWSYRFSLRTMLMITTLVAILMSFVVAFRL